MVQQVLTKAFVITIFVTACTATESAKRTVLMQNRGGATLVSEEVKTKRENILENIHGTLVSDPYRWLENGKDKAVKEWARKVDAYSRHYLSGLPNRREISNRLENLYYQDKYNLPIKRGDKIFYWRKKKDAERPSYIVENTISGESKVLLDVNRLGKDVAFTLSKTEPSWDGNYVILAEKVSHTDEDVLKVIDVQSGKILPIDTIFGSYYGTVSWSHDNKGFFYVSYPTGENISGGERLSGAKVRYHHLSSPVSKDEEVTDKIGSTSKLFYPVVSDSSNMLIITKGKMRGDTEIFIKSLEQKDKALVPLITGGKAAFRLVIYKNRYFVHTSDGAPNFRLFSFEGLEPDKSKWSEIVEENPEAKLQDVRIIGGKLLLHYLKNVSSELQLRTLDGDFIRNLGIPEGGIVNGISGSGIDNEMFVSFESLNQPLQILRINVANGECEVFKNNGVDIDPESVQLKQVEYKSKDGTIVPMFIMHKKNMHGDGPKPTWMIGYGGFNVSMYPYFIESCWAWMERGGIVAMPNIRGGGEKGETWHRDGMRERKQNVFDDFIAAAEWLVKNRYTSQGKIGVWGGSNGGLLAAAVMSQRPELFGAVICEVPVLDMIRFPRFGVGKAWIPEYGDPDSPADFQWLYKYSPYHNISKGKKYPAVLILTTDSDDRVDPLHARKFYAMMQWAQESGKPTLMRIEKKAGHEGSDFRREKVEKVTDMIAFLEYELNR